MSVKHSELAERVREKLNAHSHTRGSAIRVAEENGVVTLRGNAASQQARRAAQEIVSGLEGVIEVIDQLQIEPPAEAHTPPQPVPPEEHPEVEG